VNETKQKGLITEI